MQDGNKLSDKAIDALIAFSWYRCEDAKPRHLSYELQVSLAILVVADQNVNVYASDFSLVFSTNDLKNLLHS